MTTSLNTFEETIRGRYRAALIGQCGDLGSILFGEVRAGTEVIDPEALFWSSLRFFDSEPRLAETVTALFSIYGGEILHHRAKKHLVLDERRAARWKVLTRQLRADHLAKPHGLPIVGPSTALLRARKILGGDVRHFLLIYLLATESGSALRQIANWSGYGYRIFIKVALQWEAERVISIDRGNCHLISPEPWRSILRLGPERLTLVNWFRAFSACDTLLDFLHNALERSLPPESPVVRSYLSDAKREITSSLVVNGTRSPTLDGLLETITEFENAISPANTAP